MPPIVTNDSGSKIPVGYSYIPDKKVVEETYLSVLKTMEAKKEEIKEILTEAYSEALRKDISKAKITHPELLMDLARKVIVEKDKRAVRVLVEGFLKAVANDVPADRVESEIAFYNDMLKNVFVALQQEAAVGQISPHIQPYIMLSVPLLRIFFPRTVLKKVTTTVPANIPNIAMYFIKFLTKYQGQEYREPYAEYLQASGDNVDISPVLKPLGAWETNPVQLDLPVGPENIIQILKNAGVLDNTVANDTPMQKGSIKVVKVGLRNDTNATSEVPVNMVLDELGHVSGTVSVPNPDDPTQTVTLHIQGSLDFKTNTFAMYVSGVPSGQTAYVALTAVISLELRDEVQEVQIDFNRIDFSMRRIEKTIKFSPEFAYDAKALFNIDVQTELLTVLATILAVSTDAQGLFEMIQTVKQAVPQNIETVDVSEATVSGYMLGPKYYYEAYIIPKLNALIGRIIAQTAITDGEFALVCHPEDAAFFKSMNNYEAVVQHLGDSQVGYKVGQLNKEINVYDTPVVPKGHALLALVPRQGIAAVSVYAPYVTLFVPYPVANVGPAFTGIHRFGFRVVRPEGLGLLRLAR